MIRQHYVNGWYCDALPSGAFVVLLRDSHLETDRGRVELPKTPSGAPQNVLFVTMAPDGIRFAGQGHQDGDIAWEWTGEQWISHGHAPGVRPCIYDADGVLHIARAGGPTGSQGWRSVAPDGSLVPADATMADLSRRIWEYTTLPSAVIGQSGKGPHGEDAVLALYQGTRRILAEGQCRFIHAREGERVSLAWVQEHDASATLLWLDASELASFPEQRMDEPQPEPEPEPEPEPDPMPVDEADAIRLIVETSRDVDREHRGLRNRDLEGYQRIVARRCFAKNPHIGRKSNHGTHVAISRAALGIRYDLEADTSERVRMTAVDYVRDETSLTDRPQDWMIPGDQNGLRPEPEIHRETEQYWIEPEPISVEPEPDPEPQPGPPPPPDLSARVAALEFALAQQGEKIHAHQNALDAAAIRLDKLEEPQEPTPEPGLTLEAIAAGLEVLPQGSSFLRHGHGLKVK